MIGVGGLFVGLGAVLVGDLLALGLQLSLLLRGAESRERDERGDGDQGDHDDGDDDNGHAGVLSLMVVLSFPRPGPPNADRTHCYVVTARSAGLRERLFLQWIPCLPTSMSERDPATSAASSASTHPGTTSHASRISRSTRCNIGARSRPVSRRPTPAATSSPSVRWGSSTRSSRSTISVRSAAT